MLQVSKALVNSFFYIFVFNVSKCSIWSFTDARPSLFSVPQNCLERMRYFNPRQIHHENMAQIYFTEMNTYIYSKRANCTAQGSEVWENTDQVNTNDNARIYLWTTLPYDIPV